MSRRPAPTEMRLVLAQYLATFPDPAIYVGGDFVEGSNAPGNGPRVQLASGAVTVPMKGGIVSASLTLPDPADVNAIGADLAIPDWRGDPLSGDRRWELGGVLDFPDGAPLVAHNVGFGVMVSNQSGAGGLTREGLIFGIEFTASRTNPRVRYHTVTNGVIAGEANGNSAIAGVVGVRWMIARAPTGAGPNGSFAPLIGVTGIDANGIAIAGAAAAPLAGVSAIGTDQTFARLFMYRTVAGTHPANAIAPSPRLRIGRPIQLAA